MPGVGSVVVLAGYVGVVLGWARIRGCNVGVRDIVWPGRYKGCNPDSGSAPQSTATGTTQASLGSNTTKPDKSGKCPTGYHLQTIPISGGKVCVKDGTTYKPHPGR